MEGDVLFLCGRPYHHHERQELRLLRVLALRRGRHPRSYGHHDRHLNRLGLHRDRLPGGSLDLNHVRQRQLQLQLQLRT